MAACMRAAERENMWGSSAHLADVECASLHGRLRVRGVPGVHAGCVPWVDHVVVIVHARLQRCPLRRRLCSVAYALRTEGGAT